MRVAVVGAGIGGLLAAAELRMQGVDVVVFEAEDRPGGVAQTVRDDGYLFEPAAGAFLLPHPVISPLLSELERVGISVDLAPMPGAADRYLWDGATLHRLPGSPKGLLQSPLVGPGGKLRAAAEPLVRSRTTDRESLHGFMVRRLGEAAGGLAAHLMAIGVYAGDPRQIDAAAYSQVIGLEDEHGSLVRGAIARRRSAPDERPALHVPAAGVRALADGLAQFVGEVHYDTPVSALVPAADGWEVEGEPADGVVLAVAPEVVAHLLPHPPAGLNRLADAAPVVVVGVGVPAATMADVTGFGVLAGPRVADATAGILFENAAGRAPEGHRQLKIIAGGSRRPDVADWSDAEVIATVVAEAGRWLGTPLEPSWTRVARGLLPQHTPGHLARVDAVSRRMPAGVHLAGWWYRGIGVGSLGLDAWRIGLELSRHP